MAINGASDVLRFPASLTTRVASPSDLPRKLTLFDGPSTSLRASAALLVGSVIGSGIFVVPSLIAQRVPEPGLVIAIWVFSARIS